MIGLLLFALSSILQFSAVHGAQKCPLCNSLEEVPKRLDYILIANPLKTCADAWLELARMDKDSGLCSIMQEQFREKCCGQAEPPAIYVPPAPAPKETPQGTEPMCRLCRNDKYPGKPNARIVARYIGSYTCGQLYDRGRNGLLPGFMCGPLQHFANSVCACPSPDPVPTPRPTTRPTRPPTGPPTSEPNPEPTRRPTPPPTRNPTPAPTRGPTSRPTALTPRPTRRPTKPPTRPPSHPPTRNPTPEPTPYPTLLPSADPTEYPTVQSSMEPTTGPTKEPTPGPSRFPTPPPTHGPTPQPSRYPIAPTFEASALAMPTMIIRKVLPMDKTDMKIARRSQGGANNIVRGMGIDRTIPNEVPV